MVSLGRPHLPEELILRDTLYLLQGISGKHVSFSPASTTEPSNQLQFNEESVSMCANVSRSALTIKMQKYEISGPTRSLVHRLAEVGHLYVRVEAYVREREGKAGVGMIEQSLCHHLQSQLTEYYRLIAVLESQMAGRQNSDDPNVSEVYRDESGLTLKRLDVWIQEWRLRMRMMSVCVEGSRGKECDADTRAFLT